MDTPEGFVGSPINIAQRICSVAPAGQVLVSDTVRALTQTVLPVTFTLFGRRQLKGVKEPMLLYVAAPADPVAAATAARRKRNVRLARWVAVGAVVAVIAAGAVWWQTRPAATLPPGPWIIAMQVPLGADDSEFGQGLVNAVTLAVSDAKANASLASAQLSVDARDEGPANDSALVSAAIAAWVGDAHVIAVVGPTRSPHAKGDIPVTNKAGLVQCSPATSSPGLTKPRFGALDLRSAFPERINFVRLSTSDDIQGPAAASFTFNDLHARQALVVDDTSSGGREVADSFQHAFDALEPAIAASGKATWRRALNPGTTDYGAVLDPISSEGLGSGRAATRGAGFRGDGAVYFGGFTDSSAADLRKAMGAVQAATLPFVSWDGLYDGSGADEGSYIAQTGLAAAGSYVSALSNVAPRADFEARFRTAFGQAPDGYDGAAFACAQIITEALRSAAGRGLEAGQVRESVRAYVVDPSHRYATALGTVGFDANGDDLQQFVSFYKVDVGALGGKGDWIFVKQQDYGPVP